MLLFVLYAGAVNVRKNSMLETNTQKITLPGSVSPHLEIGAFEALWANGVSSFKQMREKIGNAKATLPGELVEAKVADQFFSRTIEKLKQAHIGSFGVRIDGTADYPHKLRDADYPLVLLYFQGLWDLAHTKGVSVVGARKPSKKGIERTKRLVKELIKEDYTIFSGLATGIDTIAHKTAIAEGGKTVAVIGAPLSHHYPKENEGLQKKIASEFLLISQVPVIRYEQNSPKFNRFYFPERNKTMSALSEATIIVEAGETSGTLIQVKAALKQKRCVLILNSNFKNPNLTWPAKLEAAGAIRVRTTEDILRALYRGKRSSAR